MKQAAVFFDRDNTLILNDGYLGDPAGVKLAPGAADAVARAHELGYLVVVVSNQSGVARGMFTEADVNAVNARLDEMLVAINPRAIVNLHEYCPFHPEGTVAAYRVESELRKPKPGMLLRAAKRLDIDLERSWLIGDAGRDIDAGKAAGCGTILVQWPDIAQSPAAEAPGGSEPDAFVESLEEAMEVVARESDMIDGRNEKSPRIMDGGGAYSDSAVIFQMITIVCFVAGLWTVSLFAILLATFLQVCTLTAINIHQNSQKKEPPPKQG